MLQKTKNQFALLSLVFFPFFMLAQSPKTAKNSKPKTPSLKICHVPSDSSTSSKITLADAQFWADSLPLTVICNDGKPYSLSQFIFTTIIMNPLQTKEYGLANNGIPILAKKAINQLKPGDTMNFAPASTAFLTVSTFSTVPAPRIISGRLAIALIAASAAAVRKVTSATGKPPATNAKPHLARNRACAEVTLEAQGRHEPCVVPRAVRTVEAMACLGLADPMLRHCAARREPLPMVAQLARRP